MTAEAIINSTRCDTHTIENVGLKLVAETMTEDNGLLASQIGNLALVLEGQPAVAESDGRNEREDRKDKRQHIIFTESSNPELIESALMIHAEGYHAMGFVRDSALTVDGLLQQGIDKARGANVDYYLAINNDESKDVATMRKIYVPDGGTHRDLPAFKVSESELTESGKMLLSKFEDDGFQIAEIAALAKRAHASPYTLHEMLRNAIHEALGKNEVWFFSIVSTTFESLVRSFGSDNFTVIGKDVQLNDDRVSEEICLRPALVRPDTFIDMHLTSYDKSISNAERNPIMRSFMFFTEGLSRDMLSERAYQTREKMRALSKNK